MRSILDAECERGWHYSKQLISTQNFHVFLFFFLLVQFKTDWCHLKGMIMQIISVLLHLWSNQALCCRSVSEMKDWLTWGRWPDSGTSRRCPWIRSPRNQTWRNGQSPCWPGRVFNDIILQLWYNGSISLKHISNILLVENAGISTLFLHTNTLNPSYYPNKPLHKVISCWRKTHTFSETGLTLRPAWAWNQGIVLHMLNAEGIKHTTPKAGAEAQVSDITCSG